MDFTWIGHLVLLANILHDIAATPCPHGCSCRPTTVRCINIALDHIPVDEISNSTVVLDLRYNSIKELKKEDFDRFPLLENLFLGNNAISYVKPGVFSSLKNLKNLYLYNNKLQSIEDRTFYGLNNLEQLYIQNNEIQRISPNAFKYLSSLRRLFLRRNQLTSITANQLSPLRALRKLQLTSNKIECSCSFVHLMKSIVYERGVSVVATCILNGREEQTDALKYSDLGCYKPRFKTSPSQRIGHAGRRVNIHCEGDGYPPPTISWFKDGRPLTSDLQYRIHANGTLSLFDFSQVSAGYYQCSLTNLLGRKTAGTAVTFVNSDAHPSFVTRPADISVIQGRTALFNCRVTGFPKPVVIWKRNGELFGRRNPRVREFSSGELQIRNAEHSDSGTYTCFAENRIGYITHSVKLTIQDPPKFIVTPTSQSVLMGGTAELQCSATGTPKPLIIWKKDKLDLPTDGRFVILLSGTLRILRAGTDSEGIYECRAANIVGSIKSQATLSVERLVSPTITNKPSDTTVESGDMIRFQCLVSGTPPIRITWTRNNIQVSNGGRFIINDLLGRIEIKDVGKIDEGRWECRARNDVGYVSVAFSLKVNAPKDGNYKGDRFVLESFEKARSEVDRAIELTKRKLENFKPRSPSDLLALFRFPSSDALKIARSAEIFEAAIDLIQKSVDSGLMSKEMKYKYKFNNLVSPDHIRLIANLSGCTAHNRLVNCSNICFHKRYRSYDGSCNNFNHPMWGASLTPFTRLLIPNYENGFNTPLGWNKTKLPSAREISLKLISSVQVTPDEDYTHMLMQWGQFIDHDLDFTVTSPSSTRFNDGKSCKDTCENEQPCFPIEIPKDDPRIKRYKCMEFTRSSAVCGSGSTSLFFDSITPRQQINQITSYIDASNVYGSTPKEAADLRDLGGRDKGLLKTGLSQKNGKSLLPFNVDTPIDCQVNKSESKVPCFLAGDHRANEQLGLLSMHTLWMRQHNRIATQLGRLNPHWDGEKVYQETRKIVGAQMQHITYNEWLPKVLGSEGIEKLGKYAGYDPNIDPSIFNAFATAAFRFGHTLIQPFLARLNSTFQQIPEGSLPLHKAFFSPYRLVEEGGMDPLLRGLFASPVKSRGATHQSFNSELTEHLFEMAHNVALDLAALNVQRGRDHGLPYYNDWRQFCNISVAKDFDDLVEIKNKGLRNKLKQLYGNVDQVDLFVGGILEDPLPNSRLGPTFLCMISLQFKRLRDGDRFWYESPSVFSNEQLVQIKQTTLSRVICDNSDDIRHVQRDAFRRVKGGVSEYTPCFQHPIVDLRFWKECCKNEKGCSTNDQTETLTNFIRTSFSPQANFIKKKSRFRTTHGRRSLENSYKDFNESVIDQRLLKLSKTLNYQKRHERKDKQNRKLDTQTLENLQNSTTVKLTRQNIHSKEKHSSIVKKKFKFLEKKIHKLFSKLKKMQSEMFQLKALMQDENDPPSILEDNANKLNDNYYVSTTQCVEEYGVVRDHLENWFDQHNRKCECKNTVIQCL